MDSIIWIILAVVIIFFVFKTFSASLDSAIDNAIKNKNINDLLAIIKKKAQTLQPTAYNHAIRGLWDAYERDLATQIMKDLAIDHKEENITQYWLKQVMTVEPEIANLHLGTEFMNSYYIPEVADKCGSFG